MNALNAQPSRMHSRTHWPIIWQPHAKRNASASHATCTTHSAAIWWPSRSKPRYWPPGWRPSRCASAPEQLVTAIRQVASGKKYVSSAVAEVLANAVLEDGDRPLHDRLSDREFQTLRLIASGRTPAQIAEALNISVKTVSVYRARLLEKMNMRNNAELIHYGIRHGLVD